MQRPEGRGLWFPVIAAESPSSASETVDTAGVSRVLSFHVKDVELAVTIKGSGSPLLFVHGFPLDHSMWRDQLEEFAEDYTVIAPDLRGFGRSGTANAAITMAQFADDLANLCDALDITEPIHYCGLSMGGYIAWEFYRQHRERLRSLILCDTRAGADSASTAETREKMARAVRSHGAAVIAQAMQPKLFSAGTMTSQPHLPEQLIEIILRTSGESIAAAALGMAARPDSTELLSEIDLPALLIVGEHDELSRPDEMEQMAALMPNARFSIVPSAGHMAPMENPGHVNRLIREFLERFDTD
mgnify:CR=1 FL=1